MEEVFLDFLSPDTATPIMDDLLQALSSTASPKIGRWGPQPLWWGELGGMAAEESLGLAQKGSQPVAAVLPALMM